MSDLSWFGLAIYLFSVMALAFLIISANGKVRKPLDRLPLKKIAWAIMIFSIAYWYVTVPYVGYYYDFSGDKEFPENLETDKEKSVYIIDHHGRIEVLERELKETREATRQLKEHYQLILQLAMYGVFYYGCLTIFGKKDGESPEEVIRLDLDKQ